MSEPVRYADIPQTMRDLLDEVYTPEGVADVANVLRHRGHAIPDPDHTAAGDVAATRAVYYALRDERSRELSRDLPPYTAPLTAEQPSADQGDGSGAGGGAEGEGAA